VVTVDVAVVVFENDARGDPYKYKFACDRERRKKWMKEKKTNTKAGGGCREEEEDREQRKNGKVSHSPPWSKNGFCVCVEE
jgi:hypothetical protein